MRVEIEVALIAGTISVIVSACTITFNLITSGRAAANAEKIKRLEFENDRLKTEALQQKETFNFSEPFARSCYDLQSRLYNLLKQNLVAAYLVGGTEREKTYIVENTTFLIGQYMCWTELIRREIQFISLGENVKTRDLLRLQDNIYSLWGSDEYSPLFRIFAGEQRAVGEALIQTGSRGNECMGYGAFIKAFDQGVNPLIDAIKADVNSLTSNFRLATGRLTMIQHALIELLNMLDPQCLRFPSDRRKKA